MKTRSAIKVENLSYVISMPHREVAIIQQRNVTYTVFKSWPNFCRKNIARDKKVTNNSWLIFTVYNSLQSLFSESFGFGDRSNYLFEKYSVIRGHLRKFEGKIKITKVK